MRDATTPKLPSIRNNGHKLLHGYPSKVRRIITIVALLDTVGTVVTMNIGYPSVRIPIFKTSLVTAKISGKKIMSRRPEEVATMSGKI